MKATANLQPKQTKDNTGLGINDSLQLNITDDNGNIKYDYVEGNTLYDIISNLNDKDGLYKQNNTYIYKGNNVNNYLYEVRYEGSILHTRLQGKSV